MGWSETAERFFDPTVQLLRPMPRTALLPFAIIFFGLTNTSALFLVTYGVFLQVYVQVVTGVKFVGRDWKRAATMLGASPRQVLWRVVLPGAMPHIFSRARLGIAYAWTLMILAGDVRGLGRLRLRAVARLRVHAHGHRAWRAC